MNKFDERYDIRLAKLEDIPMIMKFIDEHWRKNHILSKDRNLFEYEYVNKNRVNFVLAIDKKEGSLDGIFGYLDCSYMNNENKKDIWGSMWKVTENAMPLLGIELAKRVYQFTNCRFQIGNGANTNTTIPLRKLFFKEKTARMKHYYKLNENMEYFSIAVIKQKQINRVLNETIQVIPKQFNSIEEIKQVFDLEWNAQYIPFKDYDYINKRYFHHPYYEYLVYGIGVDNTVQALLIMRELEVNSKKILRIVDFIGNQKMFEMIGTYLNTYLIRNQYEYIDFYTLGFEEVYILNAGFVERKENDKNIIPNFFEPFLQQNIEIWTHYKEDNTTFFKADGDQDRPNIINGEFK